MKAISKSCIVLLEVPMTGVEPARLAAEASKTSMSTIPSHRLIYFLFSNTYSNVLFIDTTVPPLLRIASCIVPLPNP